MSLCNIRYRKYIENFSKTDLEKHWYNVAFKFDATKAQLDALLTTTCSKEQLQDRACFHATFEQKCEEDVKKAYENKHEADVAALLGKGGWCVLFTYEKLHYK